MKKITNKATIKKYLIFFESFNYLDMKSKKAKESFKKFTISEQDFDKSEKYVEKTHTCFHCGKNFRWSDSYDELCCNKVNGFHYENFENKRKFQRFINVLFKFENPVLLNDISHVELHYNSKYLYNIEKDDKIDLYKSIFFLN